MMDMAKYLIDSSFSARENTPFSCMSSKNALIKSLFVVLTLYLCDTLLALRGKFSNFREYV